jgi:hypothetical protein
MEAPSTAAAEAMVMIFLNGLIVSMIITLAPLPGVFLNIGNATQQSNNAIQTVSYGGR